MDVSENNGTPKSSIKKWVFHYIHHQFWGVSPYFWKHLNDEFSFHHLLSLPNRTCFTISCDRRSSGAAKKIVRAKPTGKRLTRNHGQSKGTPINATFRFPREIANCHVPSQKNSDCGRRSFLFARQNKLPWTFNLTVIYWESSEVITQHTVDDNQKSGG